MHDDNFRDQASEDSFQKGMQSPPLEVDSRSNVLDELMERVRFPEVLDLAFEVIVLFSSADSGVDDP